MLPSPIPSTRDIFDIADFSSGFSRVAMETEGSTAAKKLVALQGTAPCRVLGDSRAPHALVLRSAFMYLACARPPLKRSRPSRTMAVEAERRTQARTRTWLRGSTWA